MAGDGGGDSPAQSFEQQARGAMQAELEKAHTATQRLLEKLDAALAELTPEQAGLAWEKLGQIEKLADRVLAGSRGRGGRWLRIRGPRRRFPGGATAGGGAGGDSGSSDQDEFDVILEDGGDKKIQVIKEVRTLTNLGLKEAKDLVEGAPKPVLEKVNKESATKAKELLESAGGKVTIK
jgi:ribosomal protein L7/L12